MSRLLVLAPGAIATIQDLGRPGFGPLGISTAGAADPLSLRAANRLVGNPEDAPAIEMALGGAAFAFEGDAVVAVAGADLACGIAPFTATAIASGEKLRFGWAKRGSRAYLAVAGGFVLDRAFDSASVHVWSGLGGRPLAKGDVLEVVPGRGTRRPANLDTAQRAAIEASIFRKELRVTWGPQASWFSEAERERFVATPWTVGDAIDRMGLRLEGLAIALAHPRELLTEGAPLGAIQVPDGGRPIVLFVEHQTTGGYPKIANVVSADLAALGQLRPRDTIRFLPVSFEAARRLLEVPG
ncbi:MAG TPA: biotin-dependent carboxyltransferase family protein [Candidatus Polarisedimenticolaceae bacterium]